MSAGDADLAEFDEAVREYERRYWSNITFVDDAALVEAMDALCNEIRYFREGLEPPSGLSAADRIKQRAYAVARACRKTIRESGRNYIGGDPDRRAACPSPADGRSTERRTYRGDGTRPPMERSGRCSAGALLERLTRHVRILEMNRQSYRLGQSHARRAAKTS